MANYLDVLVTQLQHDECLKWLEKGLIEVEVGNLGVMVQHDVNTVMDGLN